MKERASRRETVRDLSRWSIQRRTGWRGALSYLWDVMKALEYVRYFDFVKPPENVRLPITTTKELGLERAVVEGSAIFMPPEWAGPQPLSLYTDRATIWVPSGLSSVEKLVPLSDFRIARAQAPASRWFPKCATAEWELVLVSGEQQLVVRGSWLTLAWLGYLGEWAEPRSA